METWKATLKISIYSVLAVLMLAGTISACASAPSANVPSGQFQISSLKSIAVVVTKNEEFSVRVLSVKANMTLPLASIVGPFGLLAYGIESGIKSSKDAEIEEKLKPLAGNYDPASTLAETAKRRLESAGFSASVATVDSQGNPALPAGKESDGILRVTLREWGLRLCIERGTEERVQVGAVADVRLLLPDSEQVVWERKGLYYLDGKCHLITEFHSRKDLLKIVILGAVTNFGGRIANEVLFP